MRYFAIHATMRTGSNLLERSLALLGDTACYGEAYNPGFIGGPRKPALFDWTVADRDADPFGFLGALRREAAPRIVGFRIFDGHAPAVAAHTLSDPDCARIVLTRDPLHAWVSLQIARQTGQWMLRDPRRRRPGTVRFDPVAFSAWRARVARHYDWIDETMARAGTRALRLDYAQLSDSATIVAAARHVGSTGAPPAAAPIVRQNPERLCEKVENYDLLRDWLGQDPDPPVSPPAPGAVLLSRHLPLALAPIAGPALIPAMSLVQRLDARMTGAPAAAPGRLAADPSAYFGTGPDALPTGSAAAGRHGLALACHPAERLHGLFLDMMFGPGPESPARRAVAARAGALPVLRALQRGAAFPPAQHRAAFEAFLDLVAEARQGRGPLAASPARLGQAETLDGHRAHLRIDTVGRLDAFPAFAAATAAAAGQPPLPPGQVAGIANAGVIAPLPLARVTDAALTARIRGLHGRDYAELEYEEMPC